MKFGLLAPIIGMISMARNPDTEYVIEIESYIAICSSEATELGYVFVHSR